jgi:membrane-associated phospholipid phosphatase
VQLVWAKLGVTGAAKAFAGHDTNVANPVAALPSLHAAWPFLLLLFTWRRAPRLRWLVIAYNAAMMFILVYGAEHYVSDLLLGYLYAAVGFVVVNKIIDRRDQADTTSESTRS